MKKVAALEKKKSCGNHKKKVAAGHDLPQLFLNFRKEVKVAA